MQQTNAALEWDHLMREGRFADAWTVYDGVLARATPHDCSRPRHLQIVWTGTPLAGKRVLVRCYHGLGDTIQFVRFARALREIAAGVTIWGQPALLPLLAQVDGVDRVEAIGDGAPLTPYGVDIEIMELPHALRAEPHAVTSSTPYIRPLAPCPAEARAMIDACGTALRVGVVWRGGDWDCARNVPPALLAQLAEIPGVRLFSFQPESRGDSQSIGAIDCGHLNIAGIASVLPEIDLVISVDTMLAHLAGAMMRPTWTLLPNRCDWRWMRARCDTPWYPTMRLFRQDIPGNWTSAIETVKHELMQVSSAKKLSAGMPSRRD
ncbi:MAG TPA: glycosyltransferase family 9 protein [Rhizomicrobium sp.]|jgi:hypothetical protein|nr:glycosyltransferase family 9 protein [Rhizomicrobium sp.]